MYPTVFVLVLWLVPMPGTPTPQPRVAAYTYYDTVVGGQTITAEAGCRAALTYWQVTAPTSIAKAKCYGPVVPPVN